MANFPFSIYTAPGVWGPTDTVTFFYHEKTELIVHPDKLELVGSPKDAALALAKVVLEDGSLATSWNDILRAIHGKDGQYTLEYLGDNKPDFFDELRGCFENICKMRAFI